MSRHQIAICGNRRLAEVGFPREVVKLGPDDGRLRRSRLAAPRYRASETRVDSAGNETVTRHQVPQSERRSLRGLNIVGPIGQTADTDQTLHRISNRVK